MLWIRTVCLFISMRAVSASYFSIMQRQELVMARQTVRCPSVCLSMHLFTSQAKCFAEFFFTFVLNKNVKNCGGDCYVDFC